MMLMTSPVRSSIWLAASRDGQELDRDGRAFHALQLEGLMDALKQGLQW